MDAAGSPVPITAIAERVAATGTAGLDTPDARRPTPDARAALSGARPGTITGQDEDAGMRGMDDDGADPVEAAADLAREVAPDLDGVLVTIYPDADTLDTIRPGDIDVGRRTRSPRPAARGGPTAAGWLGAAPD